MRDKVKRFLSILMTALMLVNLLPVGALADGVKISNSVQNRWPWEPKPTPKPAANVYVYVKATGDPELIANLTINSSGWFTIGMSANVPGMGNPSEYAIRSYSFGDVGVSHQTVLSTNFTRWKYNQEINTDDITWTEFYIDNGADDYVKAGTLTWHMNGKIDIRKVPSVYTIQYVDYDTKKVIRSYDEPGYMGQKPYKNITALASWQDDEYSYSFLPVDGHPQTQTVTFEKQTDTLTFYYKKNTAAYTVNYYLNGTTTKVADSKNDTAPLGETVTKSPITVDGYTPVSNDKKSITIGTGTNEINFYYYENVTLTANSDTKTYDGTQKSVSGFTGAPEGVTFEGLTTPSVTGTDAGTYPVNFEQDKTKPGYPLNKVDTTEKYIVTAANPGTLTINKRNVVLTSETASKPYDGTALTKPIVKVTGDGFVAGEVTDVKATGSVTYVSEGEVTNTITYTEGEKFNADNYDIQKTEGKLSITAATAKVTVTITGNKVTETYDGSEKTAKNYTVSIDNDLYTEDDFTFTGEAEVKATNAGTYDMGLNKSQFKNKNNNFSDSNVEFVVNDGKLEIEKRVVTLTSEGGSKVYDGTPLTKPDVTIGGDGFVAGEVTDIKATGSVTYVSEGEVTNTITYTEGEKFNADNYDIQKTEGKLSITAATAKVTVTITGNKVTETYDGSEKTAKNYTVSIDNDLYTEDDFTFTGEAEVKATNAGTYDMGLNKSQFKNKNNNFSDSNVEFVVNDGKLVIEKRKVNLSSGTVSKTYDGTPLTSDMVTIEGDGFIEEEAWDVEAIGSVKDVSEGEVTNAITFTKGEKFNEDNYAIEKNEGKLSITPRKVTLTSATLIKDFDGTPLKNGDTPVTETFGTEKAFPDGEGVTYTFTGSQTNAGSSKNMFTYAWNEGTNKDNYTIYQIEGDLVVTPIDGIKVTITGHKDTQTYDGKPHKVEGYDVKPDNLLFTEKDIKFNGEAEATGTDVRIDPYQMGLKPEQFTNTSNNFTNVEFVVEDGQIVITPRPVTLTSETAGKTYDGTALEKPVVTVGGDGFVEGQVTEIKATGSVTNAGSVANTITFTPNKETFKEGNYAITKTEGTLTIAKRSVLITSQSATKTYDGSALTRPAVTITGDGFVPGELAKAEATGSITKVGSTPNAIQYTTTGAFNAANYSIALSVGTLTVTEKPKPEPRRTFNLTINYVYQNGKRAAASYNRGGLKNGETFDITSPVIAGYTASETVVSGTIYNRDIKVTVIYTADGVNLDDYGVPLGLGNITMNVGDCFE